MPSDTSPTPESVRPVLKWAGGKRRLLEQYAPYFDLPFGTYHEPFLGGGAVFFWLWSEGRLSGTSQLSDVNPELINFYSVLAEQPEKLLKRLRQHQRKHSESHYYAVRGKKGLRELGRAARLFYLNRTCFNGLYRENSKGEFNVPMGRYRNPRIYDPEGLQAASVALQDVNLAVRHYSEVEQRARRGDLVYFDPPYHPLNTTSSFTSYTKLSFSEEDQAELASLFSRLADKGVHVRLSNSDTPLVRDLYREFRVVTIKAARAINSKASKRHKINELLIVGE